MNGQSNFSDSEAFFRQIYLIYGALLAGQLIFMGVTVFLIQSGTFEPQPGLDGIFSILVPVLALAAILGSNFLASRVLEQSQETEDLREKLQTYQRATILRFALLEGANLFAIVAYLLTGKLLYALIFLILIVVQLVRKPSPEKCTHALELPPEQRTMILQNQPIE